MLTNQEPDRNIEDLTDTEIFDAICYLEPDPKSTKEMGEDDREKDNGVVICVCLYIALPCVRLAVLEVIPLFVSPENERAQRQVSRLSQHFQQIRHPHDA